MDEDVDEQKRNAPKKLQTFICDVEKDITLVVSNIRNLAPGLGDLYGDIEEAWEEVFPRFKEIGDRLVDSEALEDITKLLEGVGLTGKQLKLKLNVYKMRREELWREWDRFEKQNEYGAKRKKR